MQANELLLWRALVELGVSSGAFSRMRLRSCKDGAAHQRAIELGDELQPIGELTAGEQEREDPGGIT